MVEVSGNVVVQVDGLEVKGLKVEQTTERKNQECEMEDDRPDVNLAQVNDPSDPKNDPSEEKSTKNEMAEKGEIAGEACGSRDGED